MRFNQLQKSLTAFPTNNTMATDQDQPTIPTNNFQKRVAFARMVTVHCLPNTYERKRHTSEHTGRVKDPVERKRRIHQRLARFAVLSFQQHLRRQRSGHSVESRALELARLSFKFSRRSKDIALEEARQNFLEAHPQDDTALNLQRPIEISNFPKLKMNKRSLSCNDACNVIPVDEPEAKKCRA